MAFCKAIMPILVATAFLNNAFAAKHTNSPFPHGCEVTGFGFSEEYLIVNDSGQQAFYLIQNRSNKQVELQRIETREVFMSPSLTAKLDPLNWAAFASDVENLHFQCFSKESEEIKKINCRDVLEVCQYPRVKFALSNMGNYWVSTNKTQDNVINEAIRKGIYLRW
ncbi:MULTISPECIES: enhanced entry protein EnhB [unclassified Legionella]|uniref:enhanced entry protein EnhB n=1 Tax=unclassified Legionella TaxID=2622702 RepID=UPI001055B37A|nr:MULTISPECIES: enhanced entry protein EnhB [unclassified Legionella]MDI9819446.1 enhanced entry protein EnhB [Legionella sp. PL877]